MGGTTHKINFVGAFIGSESSHQPKERIFGCLRYDLGGETGC